MIFFGDKVYGKKLSKQVFYRIIASRKKSGRFFSECVQSAFIYADENGKECLILQ